MFLAELWYPEKGTTVRTRVILIGEDDGNRGPIDPFQFIRQRVDMRRLYDHIVGIPGHTIPGEWVERSLRLS